MIVREVTDLVEWPPHWGKALGVGGERSSHSGLPHVTPIIDLILKDMKYNQYDGDGWPEDELKMAAEMGFSWEECIERGFAIRGASNFERVGEICRDGMVGSPDSWQPVGEILHEFKVKFSSSDKFDIEKQIKWHMQVKSYLKMLGGNHVRFWVLFPRGNYKFGPAGKNIHPRVYDMEFASGEVDAHWEMMKRYRGKYLKLTEEKDNG